MTNTDAHVITNNSFYLVPNNYTGNQILLFFSAAGMNKNMRVIFLRQNNVHWCLLLRSSIALKWGWSEGELWCSMMVLYDHHLPARFIHPLPALPLSPPPYPSRLVPASPQRPNFKTTHFGSASRSFHYDGSVQACTHMCRDHEYVCGNAHTATHWQCFTMVGSPGKKNGTLWNPLYGKML